MRLVWILILLQETAWRSTLDQNSSRQDVDKLCNQNQLRTITGIHTVR